MSAAPQRKSYDVVVVGAGVIGLSCAWRVAQRGLSVLVLERDAPGAGASGVAAGMLAPVTEAEFGEEALLRLNLEAAALWPAFHAELTERSGARTGYRESGALVVGIDRDDAEELRRLHSFQHSLGLGVEWLSGRDCRRLEPGLSPRCSGGILARQDHQVDPAATVRALAAGLGHEGGELLGGAAVESLELDGERVTGVRMPGELVVAAGQVIVAAGCWSARLAGTLPRPPVRPVKGQILTLRRSGTRALADRLIRSPRCYVVDRGDGRVVVGATVEERGFDASVTAGGVFALLEAARETLPDVDELELLEARAALRPGSPDNAPLVGPADVSGLVWATGHHRNGVLLAPITAQAVSALVAGEEPPSAFAPFSPLRFEASGRPLEPTASA